MKFTRFCLVNLFLPVFLLLGTLTSYGQGKEEIRLQRIEQTLLGLSQTTLPGLDEAANFSVSKASLQELMRGLAATHQLNISVDPALDVQITNNFTEVKVLNLILFLAKEYQLDVRVLGSIISLHKYAPPAEVKPVATAKRLKLNYDLTTDRFTSDLSNDSLSTFAKQATQLTKKNIVLAPGLGTRLVSGYIESMPLTEALDRFAFSNNLKLAKAEDGAYILQPSEVTMPQGTSTAGSLRKDGSTQAGAALRIEMQEGADGTKYFSVDAANTSIAELLNELSQRAGVNYMLFSNLTGNTTLHLQRIPYNDLLNFLLQGTNHTYRVSDGIYLIGERNLEGFRNTKVLRMQFRPVEKLDELIPAELKKGVEIKLFKELNSVIMSGSAPQIHEISEFLKAIDQPVTNVLIEVMVVELRKGKNLQAGLNAFLSDSTVKTGGQLLGGIDMTIGSKSINDILEKFDTKGFVNIGRVTPNFYVTLKALEQNNYLNLRSTPQLSTLNGHEANLRIGQSVYYLEQTQNIVGGVTPINTVSQQYKQVSANLNIRINPMVSGDEHITLDIKAEFSDFIPASIQGAPPGNATREFTSMIRVKNQEMIILGGLEEVSKSKTGSGVPILSRIPVLKYLFSSRGESKNNNKLLVFIKPTLLY